MEPTLPMTDPVRIGRQHEEEHHPLASWLGINSLGTFFGRSTVRQRILRRRTGFYIVMPLSSTVYKLLFVDCIAEPLLVP